MPDTFHTILLMCGFAGLVMVVGSIVLIYKGVIKLGEKSTGSALEAAFKDQIKISVRNHALGLFVIGGALLYLALYFGQLEEKATRDAENAKREAENERAAEHQENSPLIVHGQIKSTSFSGIAARFIPDFKLYENDPAKCFWPIPFTSAGEINEKIFPLDKLVVDIEAPGYSPEKWTHSIVPKDGRFEMDPPPFTPTVGINVKQPSGPSPAN